MDSPNKSQCHKIIMELEGARECLFRRKCGRRFEHKSDYPGVVVVATFEYFLCKCEGWRSICRWGSVNVWNEQVEVRMILF
jgi:hypothetical protein